MQERGRQGGIRVPHGSRAPPPPRFLASWQPRAQSLAPGRSPLTPLASRVRLTDTLLPAPLFGPAPQVLKPSSSNTDTSITSSLTGWPGLFGWRVGSPLPSPAFACQRFNTLCTARPRLPSKLRLPGGKASNTLPFRLPFPSHTHYISERAEVVCTAPPALLSLPGLQARAVRGQALRDRRLGPLQDRLQLPLWPARPGPEREPPFWIPRCASVLCLCLTLLPALLASNYKIKTGLLRCCS